MVYVTKTFIYDGHNQCLTQKDFLLTDCSPTDDPEEMIIFSSKQSQTLTATPAGKVNRLTFCNPVAVYRNIIVIDDTLKSEQYNANVHQQ